MPELSELAVSIFEKILSKRSVTGEETLAYQAHVDKGSEKYLKWLASQTEEVLQARIKELEDDNRALSVANAHVVACEQTANKENSRLKAENDLLEDRIVTLSEHCDASTSKLEEKCQTLTTEISDHDAARQSKENEVSELNKQYEKQLGTFDALKEEATRVWKSGEARTSVLETDNAALTTKTRDRDAAILSKDAEISKLKKRNGILTQKTNAFRKKMKMARAKNTKLKKDIDELQEQDRTLRKEVEKAKEIIAASEAAPSPAPFLTPAPALQTPQCLPHFSQSTVQQQSSYLSPPMSSDRGGPVSNGASTVGGTRRLFDRSIDMVPMTPVSVEQPKTASSFPPQQASSLRLFGNRNPDDPRIFSARHLINPADVGDGDYMDDDDDMADGGPSQDSDDADSEGEPMDDSDDTPMVDDEPTIAPATARSSFFPLKMGRHTVTKGVVDDPGKKQSIAALEVEFGKNSDAPLKNGAANKTTQPSQDITPSDLLLGTESSGFQGPGVSFQAARESNSHTTANSAVRAPTSSVKEKWDFQGVMEQPLEAGRPEYKLFAPKGPEATFQAAEKSNSRTTANSAVRQPASSVKEELDFDGVLKQPKKAGRAGFSLAAPKGPKATLQAARGTDSRTGANGGVKKLANSSAPRPAAITLDLVR